MKQEVEVVALGDPAIGVEVARVELCAGAGGEAERIGVGPEGPGPTDGRALASRLEAVEISLARREARDVDVNAMVVRGLRELFARRDYILEPAVSRESPGHRDGSVLETRAGPDHDPLAGGIAARDPVRESLRGGQGGSGSAYAEIFDIASNANESLGLLGS